MNIEKFIQNGSIIGLGDGMCLIGLGARDWMKAGGDFYFPDFFLEVEAPWCRHEVLQVTNIKTLLTELAPYYKPITLPEWSDPDKGTFLKGIQMGRKLKKIVPYAAAKAKTAMTPHHIIHCLLAALTNSKNQYVYGYWNNGYGLLGCTPEILFRLDERYLHTVAVAGTAARDRNRLDFLNDPKEALEHQIVVDGIKETLEKFGEVIIGERTLLELPNLVHLVTPIKLDFEEIVNIPTLVSSLHPTPAVGAYPRNEGKKWLKDYNAIMPRGHFGAPVGSRMGNSAFMLVAIRNIQWTPDEITMCAGCGVVKESDPEKEWNEVQLKLDTIKKTLGLTTGNLAEELSKRPSAAG